jgi:hypothetical protein
MACTFDGKTFLGAAFDAPVGDKTARVAEILRLAVAAGRSRTAELAGYTDDLTGEPMTPSACYEQAEGILRSDTHDWWDVLVKHIPDDAPRTYGDGSSFETEAHVCPDCSKDLSFAVIRAGRVAEATVLFEPNRQEQENCLLSRFDSEFTPFRCDVCNGWNC